MKMFALACIMSSTVGKGFKNCIIRDQIRRTELQSIKFQPVGQPSGSKCTKKIGKPGTRKRFLLLIPCTRVHIMI